MHPVAWTLTSLDASAEAKIRALIRRRWPEMDGWRRLHRILAVVFLLSIPPAAYFSFTGDPDSPHPVVYLPLFPLALMVITGTWMLVRPWIQYWRARQS